MKPRIFGREGNYLYVNSADNIGRDALDEIPGIDGQGRMNIQNLHQLIEPQEDVCISDLVIGKVAIRKYIEESGRHVRNNQQPYGKRQANKLKSKADFIQIVEVSSGYSPEWTMMNSLDAFMGV